MKRAAITLFLVAWATEVLGQGAVTFQNCGNIFADFGPPPDRLVYFGEVGGEKLVGTNYAAALYYTLPGLTDLILVPGAIRLFRLPTTTLPGTWNTQPTAGIILPGVGIGGSTILQVRVWDIQQFETWEGAMVGGGLHGESNPFVYTAPPVGPPPSRLDVEELAGLRSDSRAVDVCFKPPGFGKHGRLVLRAAAWQKVETARRQAG